jgi:protein kinase-like protein
MGADSGIVRGSLKISAMSLATGDRLGPYEIVGPIGSGGMGEVYRARDTRLDRTVAIKILSEALAADPQFRERFDREAKAISHLDHPHICTLHDNATDAGVGLARPSDAQFTLTTTVAPGTETANAATDSRQVCDALDTCVTAGPITGHHIDMKAPVITITSPAARAYLVNDPAAAQYTCVDAEAATCAGSASNGAPLDTAAPGPRSFTVNATDGAGNTSSATTTYSVEYGVRAPSISRSRTSAGRSRSRCNSSTAAARTCRRRRSSWQSPV